MNFLNNIRNYSDRSCEGQVFTARAENFVEGAIVTVLVGGISVELSEVGNGRYEGMVQTSDLSVGEHGLTVRAEKEGYEPGATTQSVNVETPALYVTVELPSDTVRKGREFTLTAEVRDISNNPVDGATVSFTFDGHKMVLTEIGGGEYQIIINTKEYDEGFYTIDVLAVREGYLDGVAQESITLEKPVGIPGFPSISNCRPYYRNHNTAYARDYCIDYVNF